MTLLLLLLAQAGDQKGEAQPEVWRTMKVPATAPLWPEEERRTFRVAPGFRMELVASEPMIEAPVAVAWDPDGLLWVVEMRGYMRTIDGGGEDQPVGRISVLEDRDGDGRMDKATVFLDGLIMPRAVGFGGGGVLVGEPPVLWYCRDTDGDRVCDSKTAIAAYGRQGPVQGTDNGLVGALDNWIYNAKSPLRLRFKMGEFVREQTVPRGQWGIAQDDVGRLYTNTNSSFLHAELVPHDRVRRHPFFRRRALGIDAPIVEDQSVVTARPNPGINRGYKPEMLREDGSLARTTAACGPAIYRGDRFPPELRGNAFVPEPAGNVVSRFLLKDEGVAIRTHHVRDGGEFISSTDERFRPVACAVGPDGCLTVVDMYRGILEHRISVTTFLRKQVIERGLETPFTLGRIWRVVPDGKTERVPSPRLSTATPDQLVKTLSNPNGWWRDTAQRLLVEAGDLAVAPALRELAASGADPLGRIHALWTLEGLGAVEAPTLRAALDHAHPQVRIAALRTGALLLGRDPDLLDRASRLTVDPDAAVRVHALFALGEPGGSDAARTALSLAMTRDASSPHERQAVLSGLYRREISFLEGLLRQSAWTQEAPGRPELLTSLAELIVHGRDPVACAGLILTAGELQGWRREALMAGIARANKGAKPVVLNAKPPEPFAAHFTWPGDERAAKPPRALTEAERERFRSGATIYAAVCAKCHQDDGYGAPGLGPPLAGSSWAAGPERRLIRIALQGLTGPVEVAGEEWNLEMPSLESALPDDQVAAILTYVRRSWGNEADPIEAASVAAVRAETTTRARPWTAEELLKLK